MTDFMSCNFSINQMVLACHVAAGAGEAIHKNRPSHGLAMHLDGSKDYFFDEGKRLTVRKNEIIYLPKRSNYRVKVSSPGDCYAINFDLFEDESFEPFVFKPRNWQLFLDSFKQAELVWKAKRTAYPLKCKSELYNILYQMQKESELGYLSKSKSELIRPALDYIHREYTNDNISIGMLAKLSGVSEAYFRSLFQNSCGTSPLRYINNLKLTRATELLSSGLYAIHEVAALSGFHDECYFSREFKKAFGVSPSEYQERCKIQE